MNRNDEVDVNAIRSEIEAETREEYEYRIQQDRADAEVQIREERAPEFEDSVSEDLATAEENIRLDYEPDIQHSIQLEVNAQLSLR